MLMSDDLREFNSSNSSVVLAVMRSWVQRHVSMTTE